MKMTPETKGRITRNVLLSLFIYVLPIALMFITLSITGQRPWLKAHAQKENVKTITTKTNTLTNGSND
jgi:hypothetical protein